MGMLKKAASGVLALLPCSRTPCTLRASKWLRPCWTDFFEHSHDVFMKDLIDNTPCHMDGTVHAHHDGGKAHNHFEQEGLEQRHMHHRVAKFRG